MFYKDDWLKAKERLKAFWNNDIIDRCCVAVFAPRKSSKLPPFPELQWGPWLGGLDQFADDEKVSIERWWIDPEENYRRMITWFENTYFGGEAVPATYVNWGAMAIAAFYGSTPEFKKETVWYPPVIEDWETWKWEFDEVNNRYWNQILVITKYLLEHAEGKYFVGTPEFGTAGDLLSLMRGMDKLSLDLLDYPSEVKNAIDVLGDTWVTLHEDIFQMTYGSNDEGDVLAWMSLWAPGRHDQLACDFSSVISPPMFQEFFVPEIVKEGRWCEYGTYHLDGPDAMKNHLHSLLQIDEIDTIEWTPGAGSPPTITPEYMPIYRSIQERGKRLYLLAEPQDIEKLLAELSPRGLFICTRADSEDEANELLRRVEKWSAQRNIF
jgi:hypothetical protein